jgi:hypothetical protein
LQQQHPGKKFKKGFCCNALALISFKTFTKATETAENGCCAVCRFEKI